MKKTLILLFVFALFSCTQEEVITEFQNQVKPKESELIQITKTSTFKLHKESYLNQRSGIIFWWNDTNGFTTNLNETRGFFSNGNSYHDVNGDGFLDILVTYNENSTTSITTFYLNDGTNTLFKKSTQYINGNTNGISSHKILKTDINNDGLVDFILLGVIEIPGNYGGNFTTLVQQKNGTFDIVRIDEGKGLWYHNGAAGDLNGDGIVDVITADYIWWGDGTGNFTNSQISISEYYAKDVLVYEIIDINKDGFNDLILSSAPLRNPSVVVLNNKGKFETSNTKINLPFDNTTGPYDVEIYDIDGDTDLDVIELRMNPNTFDTKLYTYINDNLKFTLSPDFIQNSEDGNFVNGKNDKFGWSVFKFDDMDGDGNDDIISENFHDGDYNGLKKINGVWKKHYFKFGK